VTMTNAGRQDGLRTNETSHMRIRPRVGRIVFLVALVAVSLSIANYIGWLRLKPEVSAIAWIANKAGYENHVVNIHHRALARVQPDAVDAYLPIYDIQNPGFFLLVAELFVRAGATTPLPLEVLSIVLFNIGTLCFFLWVYLLFSDLIVAAFATAFLALSQFFLFFPGITHTMPFEFVFFNATLLLFVLYLKNNRPAYLAGALVAMFLTCMNYWFYYMSSWIIMIGLWWQYRGRPGIRDVAMISAPPIAAAVFTTLMVMSLSGGVRSGGFRLLDIFVARTIDARVPGGTWYPNQRFMSAADWREYPSEVFQRLEWSYGINRWFFIAAGFAFVLLWFRKRRSVISALILLAGGFSWYYVMFQHTHIHWFAGQYSFMAICPILGLIVSETVTVFSATWHGTTIYPLFDQSKSDLPNSERWTRLVNISAAIILLAASSLFFWPYLKKQYDLVRQTTSISHTVEAKYKQAIQDICRKNAEITLVNLQLAAKEWGIDWYAKQLADTNKMPTCPPPGR
jgi:hypothetical protein